MKAIIETKLIPVTQEIKVKSFVFTEEETKIIGDILFNTKRDVLVKNVRDGICNTTQLSEDQLLEKITILFRELNVALATPDPKETD